MSVKSVKRQHLEIAIGVGREIKDPVSQVVFAQLDVGLQTSTLIRYVRGALMFTWISLGCVENK